jgi:hypothetical protein
MSHERSDGTCRRDHKVDFELPLMTGNGKFQLDESRPATLHNGAVSTDFPTLQEAIRAWHRLRPEEAQRASIRIIGGELYAAQEIPKLLNGSKLTRI